MSQKARLLLLESPWNWDIPETEEPMKTYVKRQEEKSNNITEENKFQWTKFTLHIILAFEYLQNMRDRNKALAYINLCEEHLDELTSANCNEALFACVKKVLWHVVFATKAYILQFFDVTEQEIEQIIVKAEKFKPTNRFDRAGILGIKAGVFIQYGFRGQQLALEYAREAQRLDSDQAEWHFIVGNCLGRIRRKENRRDCGDEEITAIEKATILESNATYIVHLAQLFSEKSHSLFYRNNKRRAKVYATKAVERYREAIDLRPDCSSTLARAAHGLLRIKYPDLIDIAYVKGLLDKVVSMAPNNAMVNHDLGFYYERFENDAEKAMVYLYKAHKQGNIKAFQVLTVLKWKQGLGKEIIKDIEDALEVYTEPRSLTELLIHLGASYLVIEDDMEMALKYFNQALSENPETQYLQHYLGFTGQATDLLGLVVKEIQNPKFTSNNCAEFLKKTKELVSPNSKLKKSLDQWINDQWKVAGRENNTGYGR